MNIIQPSATFCEVSDPYKKIELIGRTCYKSEDKITNDSCYRFVKQMREHGHFAMLEHAWFHFRLTRLQGIEHFLNIPALVLTQDPILKDDYILTVSLSHLVNSRWTKLRPLFDACLYMVHEVYGNGHFDSDETKKFMSVGEYGKVSCIIGLIGEEDLEEVFDLSNEDEYNDFKMHKHLTWKFVCDRGVTHELVRHRISFAQESTRYVNYSKEKFGSSINVVKPSQIEINNTDGSAYTVWKHAMINAEESYMELTEQLNIPAQTARSVLPTATKADIWATASMDQWDHFFNMRSIGVTGSPHPDMKVIADIAYDQYMNFVTSLSATGRK